jgi:hypothetical protein
LRTDKFRPDEGIAGHGRRFQIELTFRSRLLPMPIENRACSVPRKTQ